MKKCWIIDLESFTVEAESEDHAVEEAFAYIKQEGVKIDRILECVDYRELTRSKEEKSQDDE